MATQEQCAELVSRLRVVGAVCREISRSMPSDSPPASVAILSLLARYGEMRASRLAELLDVDISVASRHITYTAERGWVERMPDPQDKRSRLLRLSSRGEEVLRTSSDRAAEVLAARLGDWADADVEQLSELLVRLRDSFGDCRPRAHAPRTHAN